MRRDASGEGRIRRWLARQGRSWVALLLPLVAVVVQWALWPLIRPHFWFLFFPAVFVSSWIGGRAAGLRAAVLSALLAWWLFIPPEYSWAKGSYALLFPVAVFLAMGVAFSWSHDRLRRSERRMREMFDQASEGVFVADLDGRYTDVNEAGCRMLGYSRDELLGRPIAELIPPADVPRLAEERQRMLAGGTQVSEWTLRRKDGSWLPVEVSAKILPGRQWQAFVRDISERRLAQEQLRQAATVFDSTNEAIVVADAGRRIVTVNQAFTAITGYQPHEVVGRSPSLLRSGRQDEAFYRALWDSIERTGQWQGEIWDQRKNGELFPAWENISAIRDAGGAISHYVAVLSDITPVKRAEERLEHLAHHDPLTGLPNRLLFVGSLRQSIEHARRHGEKVALLFIDLDRFKLINDSLGHPAGDALLKTIGARLKAAVRAEDVVTRFGGDEFTVALDEVADPEAAGHLAGKLIAEISRPLHLDGHEVAVGASIGIALFPDDAEGADELIKMADTAMYRAKEQGRGTYEFYTRDISLRVHERLALENELRRALERGELRLHYQPRFEPVSRQPLGVEALLRWQHPKHGLIGPERFIGVAEDSGLINAIGAWVLNAACAQARAWLDRGLAPVCIAVNVSGRQILYDHLSEEIEDAMRIARLSPADAAIEIEITESVLQHFDPAVEVLRRLRALGIRVAIDDFGTGYSSLGMLKQLPVDTLKIDRVFVRHLPDDGDSRAIVGAIVSMAHTLGLRVVAEGVETEAQLAFLCGGGCDEVQGYLLAAPAPPEEVAALLAPEPALPGGA